MWDVLVRKRQVAVLEVIVRDVTFAERDAMTDVFPVGYVDVSRGLVTLIKVVATLRIRSVRLPVIGPTSVAAIRLTMVIVAAVCRFFVVHRGRSPRHRRAPSHLSRHDQHHFAVTGKRETNGQIHRNRILDV